MSIYNGPSEQQFEDLARDVRAQYDQTLQLRADVQELVSLLRAIAVLLVRWSGHTGAQDKEPSDK